MFKKVYSALMLLMMSSMLLTAATDSDELASIAPEEGCYASLRDYLFKKKTMFDDNDVMGGDEEGSDQELESEEPEVTQEEKEEPEVASEVEDSEVAPDTTDDAEAASEEKEEPEVAPEGVLGVDEEGTMSGPAPVISPEEQAAINEAEQNPDVALILQNFEDEDDFDEEALIGALLGAGVAAGLAALLAKKFMDMKKKKTGNFDGQPKVTADDGTLKRVQSGKIGTTIDTTPRRPAPGIPVRPVSVSVTDLPENKLRPGTSEVVKSDKPDLFKDQYKAIGKELKGLQDQGLKTPSQIKDAYQRKAVTPPPLPAGAKDPLALARARLAEKRARGADASVVDKEPTDFEKKLAARRAIVDKASPDLPRRNLAADDAEQARLRALADENKAKKAPKPRKYVGKYGAKG